MTIVVGYIPTPEGEAALSAGVVAAQERRTELVVISGTSDVGEEGGEVSLEQHADALSEKLDALDVLNVVIPHDPTIAAADDILGNAREQEADLIVIGLRRRSPVGKLIMGSTAQRVLLEADCPVMAVKR
jgi:nucleotide-binding universal stress UspA family protein